MVSNWFAAYIKLKLVNQIVFAHDSTSALVIWIDPGSAKIVDVKLDTGSDPFFRGPFEL